MNYIIDGQDMDFDLSGKQQDSPQDYQFARIINSGDNGGIGQFVMEEGDDLISRPIVHYNDSIVNGQKEKITPTIIIEN